MVKITVRRAISFIVSVCVVLGGLVAFAGSASADTESVSVLSVSVRAEWPCLVLTERFREVQDLSHHILLIKYVNGVEVPVYEHGFLVRRHRVTYRVCPNGRVTRTDYYGPWVYRP